MKLVSTIILASFVSVLAFADDHTAPAATDTAVPATSAPAETKKMSKKEAKMACKAEGKKGKDLKTCMKSKTM